MWHPRPFLVMILSLPLTAAGMRVVPSSVEASTGVRVATWNLETVGPPGSMEYNAALSVLNRIGANVIAIQGIGDVADSVNLHALAADAGDIAIFPDGTPDASSHIAILTNLTPVGIATHTSTDLSGDPSANDLSEYILEVAFDLPDNDRRFTVTFTHWKSGTSDEDEFRRSVESYRLAQLRDEIENGTCDTCDGTFKPGYVLMGDVNEEIDSVPQTPNPFTSVPTGLPMSFVLGSDLATLLPVPGIENDPFAPILSGPTVPLAAPQLDGSDATRPASGRRLDYIFVSPLVTGAMGETYDSADEGLPGGLPKLGAPLSPNTSNNASPNLPVFGDISIANSNVVVPKSPPDNVLIVDGEPLVFRAEIQDPGCDDKCIDVTMEWDDDFTFPSPNILSSQTDPNRFLGLPSGEPAPLSPTELFTWDLDDGKGDPLIPGTYYWRIKGQALGEGVWGPWSEPRSFTIDPTGPAYPLVDWFQTTEAQFQKDDLGNAMTDGDGVIIMNEAAGPGTLTTPAVSLSDLTMYPSLQFTQWKQVIVEVSHPDNATTIQIDVLDDFEIPLLPPTFDSGLSGPRDVPVDVPLTNPTIKVRVTMTAGSTPTIHSIRITGDPATTLAVSEEPPPRRFRLLPARPNPFRTSTDIIFEVSEVDGENGSGALAPVSLRVFDLQGRIVRTLIHDAKIGGRGSVSWDGRDDRGVDLPAGIYLYRVRGGDFQASGKLVRVR